jgi:exopolysaccharide biosynthesis polyprenyl glycosylphosphotransferase
MFALAKILKINQTTMVYLLIYHAILAVLLSVWRIMARGVLLRTRHRIKSRVLFLGWDDITSELILSMRFHDFKIVGMLLLSENPPGNPPPLENLGAVDQLQDVVDREMVDVIVTPILADLPLQVLKKIYHCRYQGIRVYDSPYLYEILTGKVSVRSYLQRETTPYLNIEPFLHPFFRNVKRLMDCVGALIGLLVTSPIFLIVMILQKVFSPGPIFFVQQRVGFQEQPFSVIKFRTMIPDAEKHTGPIGAVENDDRVTRIGKILRKYRLDELPQLLVILRGDMSFVGPRPIRRFFVNRIEEQMPFYSLRYSVKPGLTGWAQVHGRAGGSMEGHIEKFQYDLYYIKHASLFLDLLILLKTFQTLIRRPGF